MISYAPPEKQSGADDYRKIRVRVNDPQHRKLIVRTRTGTTTVPGLNAKSHELTRRSHFQFLCGAVVGGIMPAAAISGDFNGQSDSEKEKFLKLGRILSIEEIGHGVTKPMKIRLELNGSQHFASVQTVNKQLPDYFPESGGAPIPSRDCWRFNVAAYQIDRILDLRMVPVAVQRPFRNMLAAITWWVDDVISRRSNGSRRIWLLRTRRSSHSRLLWPESSMN